MADWATFAAGATGTVLGVASTLLVDRLGATERYSQRRAEAVDRAIASISAAGVAMTEQRGKGFKPDVGQAVIRSSLDIAALERWGCPDETINEAYARAREMPNDNDLETLGAARKAASVLNKWLLKAETEERQHRLRRLFTHGSRR